jgi:hypothetical protein
MGKVFLALGLALALATSAQAIHRGEGDLPYSQPVTHPLDKPVNDKYGGKAFFMNLGPTGIRARIDPEAPRQFKVTFVFQDAKSPARGLIEIGDMIVGANGRQFQSDHGFHRKQAGSRGWQGPPFELAQAIEDSQGRDGKLSLMVWPGGKQGAQKNVVVQLEPVGRFSPTYPWNCPRSDKLRQRLCSFLIDNGIKGRHHYQIQQLLALWAAGDQRAMPLIQSKARELMNQRYEPESTGMITWGWGYTGIFLGEYYNMTRDRGVLSAVQQLVECYRLGIDWRSGGCSHRPFIYIQRRIADGGPKGYGAMAGPGGLSMLAQSTFKANSLPYDEATYERQHQAFLATAGGNSRASIAYGFKPWTHAVIEVTDPKKGLSGKGVGYQCPTGMNNIGTYTISWPTKADPRWTPTDWVANEAATNMVFEAGGKSRLVVRRMLLPEPTGPYRTDPDGGGHVAPMGMGAAAHFVGNDDNRTWQFLGAHLASGCALSPKMIFDGHADATMHGFFSVIGAAWAQPEQQRAYLDYVKTLLILSEPHDGQGLVEQPFGCQRNATCSIARDRTAYTHVAILLLSLPRKQLLITGAQSKIGPRPVRTTSSGSGRTGGTTAAPPPSGPMADLAEDGFEVTHCKREAELLNAGRQPLSSVLRTLDAFTEAGDDKGKEAAEFAKRLRKWIDNENKELLAASKKSPVKSLIDISQHRALVQGLDAEKELLDRMRQIKAMVGASQLSTAYRSLDGIERAFARHGNADTATRAKQRVAQRVEAVLNLKGLDDALKAEAEALLEQLNAS